MSPTYAANTDVSSDKSRAEIERTLQRYGASSFAYGWDDEHGKALIGFRMGGWQIRFTVPLPDRNADEFVLTPSRKWARSDTEARAAYERAVRQKWWALALVVKAKLEAVDAGIVSFEEEFGMHVIMPGGATVAEQVVPRMREAYEIGQPVPLLQIESAAVS